MDAAGPRTELSHSNPHKRWKAVYCLFIMTILGYGFANGLRTTLTPFDESDLRTQIFWERKTFLSTGLLVVALTAVTPNRWLTIKSLLGLFICTYTALNFATGDSGWWKSASIAYFIYFFASVLAMGLFMVCAWLLFTYDNIWTRLTLYLTTSILAVKALLVFVGTVWGGLG
jgi:hypothetical protein